MSILVLATAAFVQRQLAALRALAPEESIHVDPAAASAEEVEAILAFRLAPGIAPRFPALRFVACTGAGADDLVASVDLPPNIPIVRAVDPLQGVRMAQYVALMALRHFRGLAQLERQQREAHWCRPPPPGERDFAVGVMGYGSIGRPVADILSRLGFPVAVWTRSARTVESADAFDGMEALGAFLARSRILVCTLPLTASTQGLLDETTLAMLPRGAFLINVSRGRIVREPDLVAAIDSGHLSGAALDVFESEPLPAESPLWRHPKILCTPHVAAEPRAEVAAAQFLDNLRRSRTGKPLANVVDRARGY